MGAAGADAPDATPLKWFLIVFRAQIESNFKVYEPSLLLTAANIEGGVTLGDALDGVAEWYSVRDISVPLHGKMEGPNPSFKVRYIRASSMQAARRTLISGITPIPLYDPGDEPG